MRSNAITSIPAVRFWIAILAAGLVLRIAAVAAFADVDQPPLYEYGGIARYLIDGQGYSLVFPGLHQEVGFSTDLPEGATPTAFTLPGLTLVIAGVFAVFGDNIAAYIVLFILNIIVGMLAVYLIARVAEELYGISVGRWTAVIATLYPTIAATVATTGGTPWYHATMALTILLVIRASRTDAGLRMAVLAGASAGLWVLFRSEGLAASGFLGLWIWQRTSFKRAAVFGIVTVFVFLPWSLRNTIVFDRFIPFSTNVWLNAWRGNHEGTTGGAFTTDGRPNWSNAEIFAEISAVPQTRDRELRIMEIYREHTLEFVSEHPGRVAVLYAKKLLMFFTLEISDPRVQSPIFWIPHLALMLGALAGVIVLWRRRAVLWPILAIIISNALVVSFLHVESRYQLILSILYAVFFVAALDALLTRLRGGRGRAASGASSIASTEERA